MTVKPPAPPTPPAAGPKKLKLSDIAARAGVSAATVSNAFNRPELLSPALRERVIALSHEMGYFGPDPMARAMRRREMQEVAVVYHHDLRFALTDPLSVMFLQGVATELDRRMLALQMIPKMGRRVMIQAGFQTTADALIVHAAVPYDLRPQLLAMQKPVALVDTFVPGLQSVSLDDRQGAFDAMEYALSKEPEHVVVVCLPLDDAERDRVMAHPEGPESDVVGGLRMAGYAMALAKQGFDMGNVTWLRIDDNRPDSAATMAAPVLQKLLATKRVAVVSMSDRMALGILAHIRQNNWTMPVAMIGFDDIAAAAQAGLSTVRQDAHRKGELAVCLALDGLQSVRLPVQVVVRST